MNQTPPPTHGWAYPATQAKGTKPKAHFYQAGTVGQRPLCGGRGYRGQQLHRSLRSVREMCPTCHNRGLRIGFFK